jgi:uncharacterized protein YkwD
MRLTLPPRLVAVLVAVLLAATGSASRAAETGDLALLRERALALVNEARERHGLGALQSGADLNEAAQAHARDMGERIYYAHVSPEGETVADRYAEAGGSRWKLVAENIARCLGCEAPPTATRVETLHEGWMNSPPHRENILARGLDRFGFGIVAGRDGRLYAVQTFAGPGVPRGLQPDEEPRALSPEEQAAVALQAVNRARKDAGAPPVERSPPLSEAAHALLPPPPASRSSGDAGLQLSGDVFAALPAEARADWRFVAVLAASCGGCGVAPTAADVRSFVWQWLDDAQTRERLTASDATHLGLAVRANGEGWKAAAATLGARR